MQDKRRRILILGGTGEGRNLATRAFQTFPRDVEIITSYAGRTKRNKIPPGTIREGGFGGVEGLKTFIKNESIDVLIDATHPFAKTISNHATIAARDAGCPHLILRRPNWVMPKIAQIINFSQMAEVANCSAIQGKRVFLSSGTQGLQSLAKLKNVWFLVRLITKPDEFLPLANHKVIIDSPPFVEEQELALLEEHKIDLMVSKHSGGTLPAKITAATKLKIPIILIHQPPSPVGRKTKRIEEALAWLKARL